MQPLQIESITVDEIALPILKEKNVRLTVLRLDKIHPVISGNKWFKLKYHIEKAKAERYGHIATFGGAYSNHIIATATAGKMHNLKTTGIIRGERPANLSHTLLQAKEYGMKLIFISREDYKNKILPSEIANEMDAICLVNEGGYGTEGAEGAKEILNYCKKEDYTHITCAVGTSTMMAGLVKAGVPVQKIIGVSVLKNNKTIENSLRNLLSPEEQKKKFQIAHGYHFGGYAKYTPELINFMNQFCQDTSIPTDFVYTGKLFYAVLDMVKNNSFPESSHILLIHSGGLQGNLSLPERMLIF